MAKVSWIKIETEMFNNVKIGHIRKLPERNNIVLILVMLLTMAGRCNANGLIFLTENIPYNEKLLADELGFDESVIQLAEYEDLEEQGLLVRLPADKNAVIYLISSRWTVCSECGSRFDEYSCSGCEYECDSKKEYYVYPTYLSSINADNYANQFGKTVFLTREEAVNKLEELKIEI